MRFKIRLIIFGNFFNHHQDAVPHPDPLSTPVRIPVPVARQVVVQSTSPHQVVAIPPGDLSSDAGGSDSLELVSCYELKMFCTLNLF
jgi:hypothetical protein